MSEVIASYALVEKVIVAEDKSGVDLEIALQPSGKKATARLGWDYIGNGFGLFVLPEVGDEVLTIFADGDISQGVVVKRLSNRVDKVPDGIAATKVLIVTKGDHDVDITVDGTVTLNCDDIRLGSGTIQKLVKESFKATFDSHVHGGGSPPDTPMPASDLTSHLKGS